MDGQKQRLGPAGLGGSAAVPLQVHGVVMITERITVKNDAQSAPSESITEFRVFPGWISESLVKALITKELPLD
jgi:hypothetical protein